MATMPTTIRVSGQDSRRLRGKRARACLTETPSRHKRQGLNWEEASMRLRQWLGVLTLTAFGTLLVQACGGDDTSGVSNPVVDGGSEASTTHPPTPTPPPNPPPPPAPVATCTQGQQVSCNGACVDTRSDPKNCGACGTACTSG